MSNFLKSLSKITVRRCQDMRFRTNMTLNDGGNYLVIYGNFWNKYGISMIFEEEMSGK